MFLNKAYRLWSSIFALVASFALAGGAFALSQLESVETAPETGAPSKSEAAQVARMTEAFPSASGTAMFLVFTSESDLTESQISTINDNIADIYADHTEIPFAPQAEISEDGTTASAIVPLDKTNVVDERSERYTDIKDAAASGLTGVDLYLSGPEGFAEDISNVFAGADFTLLATTAGVVVILLLVTYRSPILWIIPLVVVGLGDALAGTVAKKVADMLGTQLDASVGGILSVLVFGAGTNYALLIISRYREELIKNENRAIAMANSVRGTAPAILASGGTVLIVMAVLTLAQVDGSRLLGIAGLVGIAVAMIFGIGVLPFALAIWPRGIFWPLTPKFGVEPKRESMWKRAGLAIAKRPVVAGVASALLAVLLALPALGIKVGLTANERFLTKPDAVTGIEILVDKFESFQGSSITVLTHDDDVDAIQSYLEDRGDMVEIPAPIVPTEFGGAAPTGAPTMAPIIPGPTYSTAGDSYGGWTVITGKLDYATESAETAAAIHEIRTDLDSIGDGEALLGGSDAAIVDTKDAIRADEGLIFPSVLVVVFIMLVVVLRALVAPLLLLATVVASYFTAVGSSWLLFQGIWGFPALDSNVFVQTFLFLVALGIDYNMFLMTRVKEESEVLIKGKPAGIIAGMTNALGATGGVITSAGVLLAAVFAVLGVLPLITLTQIGVIVCVGVLLDTLLIRTVVVPSLTFLIGEKMWWPRKTGVLTK
ncbi:MAG: putative rane protein ActII-3 [Actinomycetota bacterium]|jgi:RND superfamily putative drug exporter